MEGSVNDIPDSDLIGRVLRQIAKDESPRGGVPLWSVVMNVFLLGSTYAAQLCRRYGHDPDKKVKRKTIAR